MKTTYYLIGCLALSIIAVVMLLFLFARKSNQKTLYNNGFERLLGTVSLVEEKTLDLNYNSYYIAGLSANKIYLGNSTSPQSLLVTNYELNNVERVGLEIPNNEKLAWSFLKTDLYPPNIFVYEPYTPTILHGKFPNLEYSRSHLNGRYFDKLVPLSPSTYVVRNYDAKLEQNILRMVAFDTTSSNIDLNTHILEKQIDGVFCTDGILIYNKELNQVIYIYFYRNQFIGMDTSLKVLYKGNTIDTVSYANIKISSIKSENKNTLSSRPILVNKKVASFNDRLYIQSGLLADNENSEESTKNSVIDVYSLNDQQYLFSFYIPKYKGENLNYFAVYQDRIVTINNRNLVVYKIDLQNKALDHISLYK